MRGCLRSRLDGLRGCSSVNAWITVSQSCSAVRRRLVRRCRSMRVFVRRKVLLLFFTAWGFGGARSSAFWLGHKRAFSSLANVISSERRSRGVNCMQMLRTSGCLFVVVVQERSLLLLAGGVSRKSAQEGAFGMLFPPRRRVRALPQISRPNETSSSSTTHMLNTALLRRPEHDRDNRYI